MATVVLCAGMDLAPLVGRTFMSEDGRTVKVVEAWHAGTYAGVGMWVDDTYGRRRPFGGRYGERLIDVDAA